MTFKKWLVRISASKRLSGSNINVTLFTPPPPKKKQREDFCCFIDFMKAIDTVDKIKLLKKLNTYGIKGKLLCIIRVMHQSAGMISEFFRSNVRLLQGEVLSPIPLSL